MNEAGVKPFMVFVLLVDPLDCDQGIRFDVPVQPLGEILGIEVLRNRHSVPVEAIEVSQNPEDGFCTDEDLKVIAAAASDLKAMLGRVNLRDGAH